MNTIDLHMHTNVSSDGYFEPLELLKMCQEAGLKIIAVADHNSTQAITQILEAKTDFNLTLVPAIEMDCQFDGVNFHLLAYGIQHDHPFFEEIESHILKQDRKNSKYSINYTQNVLKLSFDEDFLSTLSNNGVTTPEAIMEACLKDPRNIDNPHMQPYLEGGERSDNPMVNYYWDHFSQGKPGYKPLDLPQMSDLIKEIHRQKGLAILAHPGNNIKENEALLDGVIDLGIDGLEVYSSYHSDEQTQFYMKKALDNDLLQTCGSDFHGKSKPTIQLGDCDCDDDVKEILLKRLKTIRTYQV